MYRSIAEVSAIANTLPIGLYAKRRIPTTMSDSEETSFYNPLTDTIVISYPIISEGLKNLPDNGDVEQAIRSMLYHEVSHAILTPDISKSKFSVTKAYNIFEDERIETMLNGYFLNVDFNDQLKRINGLTNFADAPAPTDATSAFYQVVRYRIGKKKFLDKVNALLKKHSHLTRKSDWYDNRMYSDDIEAFYQEVADDFRDHPEDYNCSQPDAGECDSDKQAVSEKDTELFGAGTGKGKADSIGKEIASTITEAVTVLYDAKTYNTLQTIISNFNKKNNSGSAFRAYSGVLNPRNVAHEDYRFFDRMASVNGANTFGTFHLNLFIDKSGSFYYSQDVVNGLLSALIRLEKSNPNFSFDIVYCGEGETLVTNKADGRLHCEGGNYLSPQAQTIYRNLQKSNTYNYTIALFDGDAFSDAWGKMPIDGFKAFNHANCTIISDPSNETYICKDAPSAKHIFTHNYTQELIDNVLDCLTRAFR